MNKHFRIAGRLPLKLEELGVSVSAVLRRANLPQNLFTQARVLVTTEELFALWRAIGDVSNDPSIGLRLATEDRIERFHPMGIAALATENFGAAVQHIARYKKLTVPEEILSDKDAVEWTICFRWLLSMDAEPPVLVESCFAWLLSIARKGSGTHLSPLRLEFVRNLPNVKAIERHFGCPVVCGATRNALVFRASDADIPFVTRNAELLDMLAPQFDRDLAKQDRTDSFTEQVSAVIRQKLAGHRPSMEDVARTLHMSARTLQRRLQASGSTYQRVLEDARRQMARYYLGNSVLELNEAAYLLGYEDSNSFVRAFRSWEGMPPGSWREAQRSRAAS